MIRTPPFKDAPMFGGRAHHALRGIVSSGFAGLTTHHERGTRRPWVRGGAGTSGVVTFLKVEDRTALHAGMSSLCAKATKIRREERPHSKGIGKRHIL